MSLYSAIGESFVRDAITEFYVRAFADPIIGHLFMHSDRAHITKQQIDFATNLLGGPRLYAGKSLREAHQRLPLKPTHFMRRQVIMREVLTDLGLDAELVARWLALEDQLRALIITDPRACNT